MRNQILPPFDFSEVESLSIDERIARSIERARDVIAKHDLAEFHDAPMIPHGATEEEIVEIERDLGVELPPEYRRFLTRHRYLLLDDGYEIGGLNYDGVHFCESLWVSDEHDPKTEYLVFGKYWAYADGDQLMFDLSKPEHPVVAYLHAHGPLFEIYAPSFSLALWRLVADKEAAADEIDDDEDHEPPSN